jgi:hypothetical protein
LPRPAGWALSPAGLVWHGSKGDPDADDNLDAETLSDFDEDEEDQDFDGEEDALEAEGADESDEGEEGDVDDPDPLDSEMAVAADPFASRVLRYNNSKYHE